MAEIITLHNLSKRYRANGVWALRQVNLAIGEGEIFCLLGPNGAGKTTLVALLCGLYPPTDGEAQVAGRDVTRDPLGVKACLGVVPEEVALYPQLSARQNLLYFGRLYGLRGRELSRAIEETLDLVGLAERGDEKVGRYSSGMKRRLNIAVALLHNPRVLLLDEPTVGLDPEGRRRILDLILQLKRERGVTILYTTHYMDEAEEIGDRIGILHRGRLVAVGTLEELIRVAQAGETITLRLGGARLAPDMLDALRRLPGVVQVAQTGETIHLAVRPAGAAFPALLPLITATDGQPAALDVRSLTIAKPRLETVFLHLTGETFKGEP